MLMNAPLLVELASVAPQPWRNGGGLTREFLAWPSADDWQLRLSVADIECDGPFSPFPGVQRWFCVLQGEGVALGFQGHTQNLRVGDPPLVFDGAAAPACRLLAGPTRDLNLMLRGLDAGPGGGLAPVQAGQLWQPNAGVCGLFTAVAGVCHEGETRAWALKPNSLLWWGAARAGQRLRFEPAQPLAAVPGWWVHASALPSLP
jgi:uncharacterized protein